MAERRGALCQGSRVEIRRTQRGHLTLTDRQTDSAAAAVDDPREGTGY